MLRSAYACCAMYAKTFSISFAVSAFAVAISAKGKYAIEVGVEKELVNVLEVVKTAVLNGELDTAIENAANKLREGFGG